MRKHLAASFVLTCTAMVFGSQSGLAQSPPKAEQDAVVWSDRDLSLRAESLSPDTETGLQLPRIDLPRGILDGRQGHVLVCEPGRSAVSEPATAAYAQAGKLTPPAR